MASNPESPNALESFKHDDAARRNIPTAYYQSVLQKEAQCPVRVTYEPGNRAARSETIRADSR
jgi:adenine-specific DNA-methyltransferase